MEAGLDSLGAVELRNALSTRFNSPDLSTTLIFDHPTISALAVFILGTYVPQALDPVVRSVPPVHTVAAVTDESLAVSVRMVGMACMYPTGVRGPEGFWQRMRSETDVQSTVPFSRWDIDAIYVPQLVLGSMLMTTR